MPADDLVDQFLSEPPGQWTGAQQRAIVNRTKNRIVQEFWVCVRSQLPGIFAPLQIRTRNRRDCSAVRTVGFSNFGAIRSQSIANTKVALVGHHLYRVGFPTPARLATASMVKSRTDFSSSRA